MTNLLSHLPRFYHTSPEVIAYMASYDPQVKSLYETRDDFFDQLTVDTATWGLARWWEPMVGLKADPSYSYAYRRAMVIAKMRGHGTATKAMIASTVASFYSGSTEIEVYPPEFRFDILLGGDAFTQFSVDVPTLKTVIDDIKPAHLAYDLYARLGDMAFENHEGFHLRDLRVGVRIPNFEGDIVTFNGGRLFDGSWLFNQQRRGTLTPHDLTMQGSFKTAPQLRAGVRHDLRVTNTQDFEHRALSFYIGLPNAEQGAYEAADLRMQAPLPNRYNIGAMLIMDGDYKFDGSWKFDGSRLFDSVYAEEVL